MVGVKENELGAKGILPKQSCLHCQVEPIKQLIIIMMNGMMIMMIIIMMITMMIDEHELEAKDFLWRR